MGWLTLSEDLAAAIDAAGTESCQGIGGGVAQGIAALPRGTLALQKKGG
jgi:hypothetical protein